MQLPRRFTSLAFSVLLTACGAGTSAPAAAPQALPDAPLQKEPSAAGEPGSMTTSELVAQAPLTVLLFFSSDCPVQKAHDARVHELVTTYQPRGVSFVAVVSEAGADLPAEREAARKRALAMPVLEDRGAVLADALKVEYSTHVALLDRNRRVLYSGALDSDRTHLTDGAKHHLRNAIDATLAGRPIETARTEALGCPIRKH